MITCTVAFLAVLPVAELKQVSGLCRFEFGTKTWESNLKANANSSGRITIRLSNVPSPEGYSLVFGCIATIPTLGALVLAKGDGVQDLYSLSGQSLSRTGTVTYWDGKAVNFDQKLEENGGKAFVRQTYKGNIPSGNKSQNVQVHDFVEEYSRAGARKLKFNGSRSVTINGIDRTLGVSGTISSSKALTLPKDYALNVSSIKSTYNESSKEVIYEINANYSGGKPSGQRRGKKDPD